MNVYIVIILGVILVVWNVVLTLLFIKFYGYHSKLVTDGKRPNLAKILDELLIKQAKTEKVLDEIIVKCATLEKDGALHIQKVGLLRFNPFRDTGGDQSFILALVDARNTGVIISGLHTRTGTRWYAKHVIHGKGEEYALSVEEEKALKMAKTLPVNP